MYWIILEWLGPALWESSLARAYFRSRWLGSQWFRMGRPSRPAVSIRRPLVSSNTDSANPMSAFLPNASYIFSRLESHHIPISDSVKGLVPTLSYQISCSILDSWLPTRALTFDPMVFYRANINLLVLFWNLEYEIRGVIRIIIMREGREISWFCNGKLSGFRCNVPRLPTWKYWQQVRARRRDA